MQTVVGNVDGAYRVVSHEIYLVLAQCEDSRGRVSLQNPDCGDFTAGYFVRSSCDDQIYGSIYDDVLSSEVTLVVIIKSPVIINYL